MNDNGKSTHRNIAKAHRTRQLDNRAESVSNLKRMIEDEANGDHREGKYKIATLLSKCSCNYQLSLCHYTRLSLSLK